MNIIVNKNLMVSALSSVTRAVAAKSPILALEGVLLTAYNNSLTLTGYDLEMGIITSLEANVKTDGKIVLSAKLFFDMIRSIPCEEISITTDDKLLTTIKGGATEYTILGLSPEDYPELPSIENGDIIKISQQTLRSMINQTLFSIATVDSKPTHKGSLFDIENKRLNLVSVDGYRLAMRNEAVETNQDCQFIVPGKTLSEISKLIKEDKDDEETVEMVVSRKHIIFKIDGYNVVSRLIEGEFLDYKSAIPGPITTEVIVSVKEFLESIDRTSLLISEKLRSPLRITFEKDCISILCTTSIGKAFDTCNCSLEGETVEIGFHNRYLQDALKASGCEEIKLLLGGPLSPMRMVPLGEQNFLFLVLPVRLKTQN